MVAPHPSIPNPLAKEKKIKELEEEETLCQSFPRHQRHTSERVHRQQAHILTAVG